jgi:hypothetical protein
LDLREWNKRFEKTIQIKTSRVTGLPNTKYYSDCKDNQNGGACSTREELKTLYAVKDGEYVVAVQHVLEFFSS